MKISLRYSSIITEHKPNTKAKLSTNSYMDQKNLSVKL